MLSRGSCRNCRFKVSWFRCFGYNFTLNDNITCKNCGASISDADKVFLHVGGVVLFMTVSTLCINSFDLGFKYILIEAGMSVVWYGM